MKVKNLKIMALSLTLLFGATQALATGPICQTLTTGPNPSFQAIAKSQSWLSKIFGSNFRSTIASTFGSTFESVKNSVKSFVKNNPKTSFFAGVGVATLIGVSAWLFFLKKLKKQTGQNGQNQEDSQNKNRGFKVKPCNPKKKCIVFFETKGNIEPEKCLKYLKEQHGLEEAFNFVIVDEENIDIINNNDKKYDLLLIGVLSMSDRLTSLCNTDIITKLTEKANKSILILVQLGNFTQCRIEENWELPDCSGKTTSLVPFLMNNRKFLDSENEISSKWFKNYINDKVLCEPLGSGAEEEKEKEKKIVSGLKKTCIIGYDESYKSQIEHLNLIKKELELEKLIKSEIAFDKNSLNCLDQNNKYDILLYVLNYSVERPSTKNKDLLLKLEKMAKKVFIIQMQANALKDTANKVNAESNKDILPEGVKKEALYIPFAFSSKNKKLEWLKDANANSSEVLKQEIVKDEIV